MTDLNPSYVESLKTRDKRTVTAREIQRLVESWLFLRRELESERKWHRRFVEAEAALESRSLWMIEEWDPDRGCYEPLPTASWALRATAKTIYLAMVQKGRRVRLVKEMRMILRTDNEDKRNESLDHETPES